MSRTRSLPPALAGHVAVLTLVIVVMAGVACTQRPASTAPTPGWKAPRGGELRVGVFEQPAVLDPQLGNLSVLAGELGRCCLGRTLMSYAGPPADESGTTPRPDLAASLPQVSEDGLTWTFRLRRGLRYAPPLQDVEIVAQDFVRSFERFLSPDLRSGFAGYSRFIVAAGPIQGAQAYLDGRAPTITGIEAPDPHTLRFRLTRPSGDLPYFLAMPYAIPIPANPADPEAPFGVAQGHPSDYGSFLVASGPYMLAGSGSTGLLPPARAPDPGRWRGCGRRHAGAEPIVGRRPAASRLRGSHRDPAGGEGRSPSRGGGAGGRPGGAGAGPSTWSWTGPLRPTSWRRPRDRIAR